MHISRLLLTTTRSLCWAAILRPCKPPATPSKVTSIAQVETEVVGKDGKKTLKRTPVEKAIPGTEVIYTTTFQNLIKKPVGDIVINNPVPNASEYKAGSAFGKDCNILFSVDRVSNSATPKS